MSHKTDKARGTAFELKCKAYLESLGFKVEKARAKLTPILKSDGKRIWISSANDFFGVADLMAFHPQKDYTLFVQCTMSTGGGDVAERKDKMAQLPWNMRAHRVQVWTPADDMKGGIRAWTLSFIESMKALAWHEAKFKREAGVWPEHFL